MSQWTHVCAIIRFDAIPILGCGVMQLSDLGKTASWDEGNFDSCTVPCGSEGSLQTSLWENPNRNHMMAYTASIWGDLRDYDDVQEIKEYFERICKDRVVRSGVVGINVEGRPDIILHHTDAGWREVDV